MEIQNHIFDNVKLNIVDKNFDDIDAVMSEIGQYNCSNCGYNFSYSEIDEYNNNLSHVSFDNEAKIPIYPNIVKCPSCGKTAVHIAVERQYDVAFSKYYSIEKFSSRKLAAAKLAGDISLKMLRSIKQKRLIRVANLEPKGFFHIITLSPLFFDVDALNSLEKIIAENRDIINDYQQYEQPINDAKECLQQYKLIYDYLDYNIEYKQIDVIKTLREQELEWKKQYPDLTIPFFEKLPTWSTIDSYEQLFYCWWKCKLLHRENRKNRVYIQKLEGQCYE